MDTIFARSTALGRAGVGIVRISGPRAWDLVYAVTRRPLPAPRSLVLRKIWCSDGHLDTGMVVVFAEGQSFTGESSAEIHVHGSEAVQRRLLEELGSQSRARLARAGEFTHRALLNDTLDLSEVEGLSALLAAETEAQRKQAVTVFSGALRALAGTWRQKLTQFLATIEVTVDFADEEVPLEVSRGLADQLRTLAVEMTREADGVSAAGKIARGFEVAIVGAPNVGKSTLLNRLAGRPAALTSEIAGTTRDVLEVRIEISEQLVTLLDTAGLRDTGDVIERAGVERARERAVQADLRVFIDDVPEGVEPEAGDIFVRGKADLHKHPAEPLAVSGETGEGVDALVSRIGQSLSSRVAGSGVALTDRQGSLLRKGAQALEEAADVLEASPEHVELASVSLRSAIGTLDEVVGRIGVEDVLGEIFSQFCIGK